MARPSPTPWPRPARIWERAERLFQAAAEALGGIDILVSNVAIQIPERWDAISQEHFTTQVRINWQSGFELIQQAAPAMLERGWGRILTIGSVQEEKPHPEMVVYAALKAACIDGGIRDTHQILEKDFPIFYKYRMSNGSLGRCLITSGRHRQAITTEPYFEILWLKKIKIRSFYSCHSF